MEFIKEIKIWNKDCFISISELNCVFRESAGCEDCLCKVIFQNAVDRIDVAFIGGLFLLYKEHGIRFNLTGCMDDRGGIFRNHDHINEIKQCLTQLRFMYDVEPHWIRIAEITPSRDDVHFTSLFAPLLYIDKSSLDTLFKKSSEAVFSSVMDCYIRALNKDSNGLERDYFREQTDGHIICQLNELPPIHTFVYSILHEIGRPFVNKKDLNEVVDRINELILFASQYVAGLYELAKNIVAHSSSGRGIISIGSYGIGSKNQRNIETYVLDLGEKGIIPTMIDELDMNSPEDKEDFQVLNDGYTLADFFAQGQSHRLLRQIRREMAHLGLIHFISLVRSNSGQCRIASAGVDGGREYFQSGYQGEMPCMGTSFYFSLPLAKNISLQARTYRKFEPYATVDSLASLPFVYDILDSIRCVRLDPMEINSRDDEKSLVESVFENETPAKYLAIDFKNVSISVSGLLRVFAMISERTDDGVIVFNVSTEVFSNMVQSNDTYFMQMANEDEVAAIPYWIKNKSILVYSHLSNTPFYFADILYGDDTSSFQRINRVVNNTFPNYITISSDSSDLTLNDVSFDSLVSRFFRKSVLLPFDLILENEGSELLFYSNLRFLINKPILDL